MWLQLNKDIDIIEAVQRRATKIIPGMTNMTYTERLKLMKLPSLKYRRKRGDLIEVYKFTHSIYNIQMKPDFLKLDNSNRTRGHTSN